jgi:hemin uptake protein HemP
MEALGRPASVDEPPSPPRDGPAIRSVDSADLLQGARELFIRHGVSTYKLRVTASAKLILTK